MIMAQPARVLYSSAAVTRHGPPPGDVTPMPGLDFGTTDMPTGPLRWPLAITRDDQDGIAVFAPVGRLGTLSAGDLIEALAESINCGARRLVIDLSGVDYLSSAGLLALEAILGRPHIVNGEMVLCGLTEPVRMAFELSGLLPLFVEEPARDAALARLVPPD